MIWIEAILAFAVTMMAFSTIVSMIVEMIHRIFRLREEKIKMMMSQMYEKLILPQISPITDKLESSRESFTEVITNPPFLPSTNRKLSLLPLLSWVLNVRNIKTLPVFEFIEKLARTEEGKTLLLKSKKKGEEYLQTVIDDLVSQYENFEESAREYFTRRARFFSIIVAVCLALSMNINPIKIFSAYLNDAELRSNIIDQGDIIGERLQAQQKTLEKLIEKKESISEDSANGIEKSYSKIQDSIKELQNVDIPFGWEKPTYENFKDAWGNRTFESIKLVFYLFLGGLLIGLGGPFWFDLFRKMSGFVSIARKLQTSQSEQQDPKGKDAKTDNSIKKETDPVALFKRAAEVVAYAAESKILRRPLLNSEGHILKGE